MSGEHDVEFLARYAKALEGELMPELFDQAASEEALSQAVSKHLCGPPVSEEEIFIRDPEDLTELRALLEEAEAVRDAAMQRAWELRIRVQDEELRQRWAQRDAARQRLRSARAWVPPAGAGEAMVPEENSGRAASTLHETASPVPPVETSPPVAEGAGAKPAPSRRRRPPRFSK